MDSVRSEPDPLRRARRAGDLGDAYRQRQHELARLRRVAIDEARALGMSYTEIAGALGVSKGRITQIRGTAPPSERAFFGVGPVTVGVPLRRGVDDQARSYIDAADVGAQRGVERLLGELALLAKSEVIRSDHAELFEGDSVVICGPKSAPIAATLLVRDPRLDMVKVDNRWWIMDRENGAKHGSPRNDATPTDADLGYLARHSIDGRTVIHIAGISAFGSHGVVHYLAENLTELWEAFGDNEFSAVIRCEYTEDAITSSELVADPAAW
ncbi:hypothetical protein LV75_001084 [Actinokineospora diospyrosa]|uniref:Sigma-70-like protein n=1 Tax=Actinokineospora diospyrosa TaxID=103728 RepID=A0ABT1I7N1_9PSEU|nr:hypothetical protein [Actinokineospora diospyrosa]